MILEDFARAYAKALDKEDIHLEPESKIIDIDGWDSLCVLMTIAFADEEYEKQLSGQQIAETNTIRDLWSFLES